MVKKGPGKSILKKPTNGSNMGNRRVTRSRTSAVKHVSHLFIHHFTQGNEDEEDEEEEQEKVEKKNVGAKKGQQKTVGMKKEANVCVVKRRENDITAIDETVQLKIIQDVLLLTMEELQSYRVKIFKTNDGSQKKYASYYCLDPRTPCPAPVCLT